MNANTFFDPIKAEAFEWINAGLDSLVIPIGALICGAVFIFFLIKCVAEYRAGQGEDVKNKIFPMLLCFIIAGVLLSKNLWWGAFTSGI